MLLLGAAGCNAFIMPSMPSQKMALTRRASIQLPTQEPSVLTQGLEEDQQQEGLVINNNKNTSGKKTKGPAPVVVLEGDILESTTEHM